MESVFITSKTKLMDLIKDDNPSLTTLKAINVIIMKRIDWLECREPESEGIIYDEWEEKYEDLKNISDEIEELINDFKERFDTISEEIEEYQLIHGGISKLKVGEGNEWKSRER